ncbi:MAG: hypothetical protein ACPG77_17315 [Nannocystaceae bacterium]
MACQSQPTREQAQLWADNLAPTIEAVEKAVESGVEQSPRLSSSEPDCSKITEAKELAACQQKTLDWFETSTKVESKFEQDVLAPLLDAHPSVVGVEVSYRREDEPARGFQNLVGSIGVTMGPNKSGRTSPKEGFSRKRRQYGWGLGQTSVSFGNAGKHYGSSDYAPMLHVVTTKRMSSINARVTIVLLASSTTDAEWREAWHQRAKSRD